MIKIGLEMRKYLDGMSGDMNNIISTITNSTRTNFLTEGVDSFS